jgi:site-specific recombinase XerD
MRGVDIQTVRDLMGHSSITTTAIYLHTDPKHRREAVAKLGLPRREEREEKVIPLRGSGGSSP